MANEKFNVKIVKGKLEASLLEEDDVRLQEYLDSYDELNKFFTLMGTVFSFVSKDLKAKMDILRKLLQESQGNFNSAKSMIIYEETNGLLNKKDYVSGARTLLRLHRGLNFIRQFLGKVKEIKNEENAGTVCREAYDQTLSKHHVYMVRKGAQIAMYTLPTKQVLLEKVCGDEKQVQEAMEQLPHTLEIAADVYDRVESLYTQHNLHELP